MFTSKTLPALTEQQLCRLAEDIAFALKPGDILALKGDLGAGKTTFARAIIRAVSGGGDLEIPSPTFTLVQSYSAGRFDVAHFDLYRLTVPEELHELGLDHALTKGVAIIEWPERAGDLLPPNQFVVRLDDTGDPATRDVTLEVRAPFAARLNRLLIIRDFVDANGWGGVDTQLSYLQGDASPRRYARLVRDGVSRILMDSPRQPDGPPVRDGKPYSQIAHLAEDVRPFVAIGDTLSAQGFSTPEIHAHDLANGLLFIEDFGDQVFGREVAAGHDQAALWLRGVNTLVEIRKSPPPIAMPLPDGSTYSLPRMDQGSLQIEAELLLDWYWPALHGTPLPQSIRDNFLKLCTAVFTRLDTAPKGWALRDYHSPNLIVLEGRPTPRDTGIIDFQDALLGAHAYDLVSLLQDARLDVSEEIEAKLLAHYIAKVRRDDASFSEEQFRYCYAALGAQRNTKILGIFARLAMRDGKTQYLPHIPRIWHYLERNLAHPELAELKAWYDHHLPVEMRLRALKI
jgi:N-acetylmuramate 1-kinase